MSSTRLFVGFGITIMILGLTLPVAGHHVYRGDDRIVQPYGIEVQYHIPVIAGYEPFPTPLFCPTGQALPEASYTESFESSGHGWVLATTTLAATNTPNLWRATTFAGRGTDDGHAGASRLYFGTPTYDGLGRPLGHYWASGGFGHVAGSVLSPLIQVPLAASPVVAFATKWQVEDLTGYDHLWVEAEAADGTLYLLCSANAAGRTDPAGVNGNTLVPSCSPVQVGPCPPMDVGGILPRWETRIAALPATLGGQSVRLRFTFDSSDGAANGWMGWMVDDVQLGIASPG